MARTVRVGGRRKEGLDGRVEIIIEIDGRSTTMEYDEATHQEAVYVATLKAIRRAHADGVTDLSIDSPNNLVKGHIMEEWRRREPRLKDFQNDIETLLTEFDTVIWL